MLSLIKVGKSACIASAGPGYLLHVVETMEDGIGERCSHLKERRKLLLQQVIPVFILSRSDLKVLLDLRWERKGVSSAVITVDRMRVHLEQVFLVTQRLFLLLSELVQRVVVSVVVDQLGGEYQHAASYMRASDSNLVVALRNGLTNTLADILKLDTGSDDSRLDEFQLRSKRF